MPNNSMSAALSVSESDGGAAAAAAAAPNPTNPIKPIQRYRIGYVFAPKKEQSFIQPSLLTHALEKGIDFVPISTSVRPLSEQGPFDCIIHKLYSHEWNHQLQDYSSKYPDTLILDPPESIARLHNRVSMLQVVGGVKSSLNSNCKVSVPRQVLVSLGELDLPITPNGVGTLEFPVIAKPLLANGSDKSHEMCLVLNAEGLQSLLGSSKKASTSILLQQFANHGGVVFKVYVIGEHVQCVKRRSLPDISTEQLKRLEGQTAVLPFSQISNAPEEKEDQGGRVEQQKVEAEDHEMPPPKFVEEVARGIRRGLKLNFFNFDVIRDSKEPDSYFVIDINYFPGYAKLPSYEQSLTDFLLSLVSNHHPQSLKKDKKEAAAAATLDLDAN